MSGTTEAFARVKIDSLLKDAGWNLTDGSSWHAENGTSPRSRKSRIPGVRTANEHSSQSIWGGPFSGVHSHGMKVETPG